MPVRLWAGLTLLPVVLCPANSWAQVGGLVRYDGPSPKLESLDLRTDPVCSALGDRATADHTLVSKDGGLANVFVRVVNPPRGDYSAFASKPVVLDQQRCRYVPKVFGILVGQRLEVRNGDPTVHTTHAQTDKGFNVVTPRKGQRVLRVFDAPEVMVPITCDVHPWMAAYAGVVTHPFFAVTDSRGQYRLPDGLADGEYDLEFWHEKLGRNEGRLSVKDGRAQLNVVFTGAARASH